MMPAFARRNPGRIYFARTRDEYGRNAYYAVQVTPALEQSFLRAMRGSALVDYDTFGTIIASGFGHEPDAVTCTMLKVEYGYEIPEE